MPRTAPSALRSGTKKINKKNHPGDGLEANFIQSYCAKNGHNLPT